jgi:hypothetical protein
VNSEILKIYFLINITFLVLGILPHVRKNKNTFYVFLLNIIGYIFISVVIYSICRTKFNTIFIGALIPISVIVFQLYKDKFRFAIKKSSIDVKFIIKGLIVLNIIWFLKWIQVYDFTNHTLKILHGDYVFYAKVAKFMFDYGIETFDLSPYSKPLPYHYFELWITSIVRHSSLNSYSLINLFTYPLITTMVFLFATEAIKNSVIKKYLFGILLLLAAPFYFRFVFKLIPFLEPSLVFTSNVWEYQKFSIIYLLLIILVTLYRNVELKYFLIGMSLIPIIYGSLLFSYIGLCVACFLMYLKSKNRDLAKYLPISLFTLVWYYFFYRINAYNNSGSFSLSISFFKTSINIFGGTVLIYTYLFLITPIFVLIILKWRKYFELFQLHKVEVLVLLSGVIFGLLGWAYLHMQLDSGQVFSNFAGFVAAYFISKIIIELDIKWGVVYIIALLFTHRDRIFNSQTLSKEQIQENLGVKNIGFFKTPTDYANPFSVSPYFATPLNYLTIKNDDLRFVDLSILRLDTTKIYNPTIQFYLDKNPLRIYMLQNPKECEADFIHDFNIGCLITPIGYMLPEVYSKFFYKEKQIDEYTIWKKSMEK